MNETVLQQELMAVIGDPPQNHRKCQKELMVLRLGQMQGMKKVLTQ